MVLSPEAPYRVHKSRHWARSWSSFMLVLTVTSC